MSNNGKTMNICTPSAASTTPTNADSRTSRSQPNSAARLNMKQNTASGARRMTMLMSRIATSNRSEEHTSELQSLMRISYDVFCLKKKKTKNKIRQQL